jgi:biopolymer transport protein ExbD
MRKRSPFTNREEEKDQDSTDAINLTPLIDMMFILLIFFVVTTSFVREAAVAIQRPKAATATAQQNAEVIVTISADEQVWLNNAPVDIRLLRTRLSESGNNAPRTSAIILADSRTKTGLLIEVMDQLRLAGFVNISVAANTAQTSE